jgi:two-component system, NarL family, response regulator LiaR
VAIRVLIVDDHSVVREGLRMFLARDPDLEVVGEAADGAQAVRLALQLRPDVIIMDLLMPVMDGVTATETIRSKLPKTQVIALTSVLESDSVVEAIRAGAIGYLLKDTQAVELRKVIKAAVAGQLQLSPQASGFLLHAVRTPEQPKSLTPREMDVLRLIVEGQSNKEMARNLNLTEETIKSHVGHILAKLKVQSRTQAAMAAVRMGIIRPTNGKKKPDDLE